MKKLYTLLTAVLLTGLSFGQSPRLVLVEEFTGETCGPCAATNPPFNVLLNAHASNVMSLKYENNIPSAGPNFWPYAQTDIQTRTTFYANNYSPHAWIDGNYWNGNAASVTATQLNTRGAVTSPFTVSVSHYFSSAHDIIYVHAVIRATGAVSATTLKARLAIAERDVYGYTSPNGENSFSHTLRKMLPNATGTALQTTWAVGDSAVIDQQWTIANSATSYASPVWAMLEAIVFVQDDATKQIMQTGHSPAQVTIDPAIVSITGVRTVSCSSITPAITVTNNEPTPATSMDIQYYLDSQTPSIYHWTGTLNQGGIANITLGTINMSMGVHKVHVNISTVNGGPDLVPSNNSRAISVGQPVWTTYGFSETFTSTTFPPTDWVNEDNDLVTGWKRASANSTSPGTGSAKIDFYNSAAGQIDVLYPLIPVDLRIATSAVLSFNVAHEQYGTTAPVSNDRLDVLASTNCGATWTSIWNKSGATLSTVPGGYIGGAYTPSSAQWRAETINLSSYIGMDNVLFAFKATSDYGNNAYVDLININQVLSVAENANSSSVNLYPTPSAGNININVEKLTVAKMDITVTNIVGKVVKQMTYNKSEGNIIPLDLSNESSGNYLVKIVTDNETILKRAIIQK